jgi:phenylalanyl-tRNA synthetase beta chain
VSPADLSRFGLDPSAAVRVANPLVAEESLLRPSLLPGLVGALGYNVAHRQRAVALFEIGHVFGPPAAGEPLPDEREVLAVALGGCEAPAAVSVWHALCEGLRIDDARIEATARPGLHPTRTASIVLGDEVVGVVGEVDPSVLAEAGVDERVAWLEADLERLLAHRRPARYQPVSRYPSSDVDLAFEVDEAVPAGEVVRALRAAGGDLLVDVRLFDVYRGEQVRPGCRSLALTVRFQADDRTLTDEEVAAARRRLIEAVESSVPATLRG